LHNIHGNPDIWGKSVPNTFPLTYKTTHSFPAWSETGGREYVIGDVSIEIDIHKSTLMM
jgi:hypothetical protein